MKSRSLLVCAALLSASLAMAACSSSSTAQNGTTTTTATGSSTSTSGSTSTSSGSSALAMNVQVTDAVRTQLVAAAAGLNSIPVTEFTGLAPGLTFYALDKETNIHWAVLQPLLSDPGPDIVPGRRLVLRLPAADGWPVDRLRSRKYRSGHAVPDHRSARRARRLGMVGGWLSAEGSLSRVGVGLLGQRGRIVTEIRPGAERSWPRSQWGMLSG
jgi:hypothetical protein